MDELSYMQHSVAEQVAGGFLDEIEKLQRENKRLREALEFYANFYNYNYSGDSEAMKKVSQSIITKDSGEIACKALNKR